MLTPLIYLRRQRGLGLQTLWGAPAPEDNHEGGLLGGVVLNLYFLLPTAPSLRAGPGCVGKQERVVLSTTPTRQGPPLA